MNWEVVEESIAKVSRTGVIRYMSVDNPSHIHRMDGPAVVFPTGTRQYWQYGQLHREDGPAIIYAQDLDGNTRLIPALNQKRWFIRGRELTEEEFNQMGYPRP